MNWTKYVKATNDEKFDMDVQELIADGVLRDDVPMIAVAAMVLRGAR